MPDLPPDLPRVCRPDECLAEDWLGFLGHRWNALILWHLSDGPKRYSDLQALLPRISAKVLTERLAGMTARALVSRHETNLFPREVTYALTPRGESLRGILSDLYDWAERQAPVLGTAGTRR
ncbi:winged helix-turn-helix transcriptional regulator [Pararhodobacter marinus]|uniref:winged helix-turn-helix transcriptional regulator n=1 Tax=Pararhodobacter marinus TaxID=2184063 RepID=UPI003514E00D